jgi:hypothetical protein
MRMNDKQPLIAATVITPIFFIPLNEPSLRLLYPAPGANTWLQMLKLVLFVSVFISAPLPIPAEFLFLTSPSILLSWNMEQTSWSERDRRSTSGNPPENLLIACHAPGRGHQ